ncbi:MAG: DHH family phosphoesterase [Phycisphaeraceae bacterium]|nr:DHH family phosphoesterase [Phycisphaeraceae bacterium]
MAEYVSNIDLPGVAHDLQQAGRVWILTHAKPDGDAIGAMIALTRALRRRGGEVEAILVPPVPQGLRTLDGFDDLRLLNPDEKLEPADRVVLVDTGAFTQLGEARSLVERALARVMILDHHLGGDIPAPLRYIDGHAAATCEIIADLLSFWTVPEGDVFDDEAVREALFCGIASDTGWFRFSNTRARTHELAAMLLRRGLDQASLYQRTEQSERVEKLSLMVRSLSSLELLAGGRAAIMSIRARDFAETGASIEETDRFVDLPRMVDSVQVVVLAVESPSNHGDADPEIRLSLRSKPGSDAVNVATLAARFNGGGHARAAGARIHAPLDQALTQIRQAVIEALRQQ